MPYIYVIRALPPTDAQAAEPAEPQADVIAINARELLNGDPRMNIIIRDGDTINVPTVDAGEFYVMGEVTRPGVYNLTGRPHTVKMAIAAAGCLGPVPWPERAVIRRTNADGEEQVISVNIEKIFPGEQEDVVLQANDVIAVGSNAIASLSEAAE